MIHLPSVVVKKLSFQYALHTNAQESQFDLLWRKEEYAPC